MSDLTCSFPGCEAHPSKGDTILRISAKGKGIPFVGRCEKHYGEEGADLARQYEGAAARAIAGGTALNDPTPKGNQS